MTGTLVEACPAGGYREFERWTGRDDRQGCRYERVGPPADHGTVSLVTGTLLCGDCNEGMALAGEGSHA